MHKMSRVKKNRVIEPPAGCIAYFMLSIVINLLIVILRISAHEMQNNTTLATTTMTTTYCHDAMAPISIETTAEDVNETSKFYH